MLIDRQLSINRGFGVKKVLTEYLEWERNAKNRNIACECEGLLLWTDYCTIVRIKYV